MNRHWQQDSLHIVMDPVYGAENLTWNEGSDSYLCKFGQTVQHF